MEEIKFNYPKEEKLKSRIAIQELFEKGNSLQDYLDRAKKRLKANPLAAVLKQVERSFFKRLLHPCKFYVQPKAHSNPIFIKQRIFGLS